MSTNLEGFQPVFGEAKGTLETAAPYALLPFLFFIHALDDCRLRFQITDFHSNTWQSLKTSDQLDELRDEVGIGGSWHDFLSYLGDAFSSDNVKLILGGPAHSVGGYGKMTAQKSKGMPRISISLERVPEHLASDVMGNISVELFKAFRQKSDALVTEQGRMPQLTVALAAEKEKTENLQKQLDAYSFATKKRGRKVVPSQSLYPSMVDATSMFPSQLDTMTLSQTQLPSALEEPQSHVRAKPAALRTKVRAAPVARLSKGEPIWQMLRTSLSGKNIGIN